MENDIKEILSKFYINLTENEIIGDIYRNDKYLEQSIFNFIKLSNSLQPKEPESVEGIVTDFISSLNWGEYDSIIECDMERLLLQFSEYAAPQKQVSDE